MSNTLRQGKLKNPVKKRSHFILFAEDSPFKGRKERNKMKYTRKAKHPERDLRGN